MSGKAGEVYVGIAGWSYPDWKGIVYTESRMDELAYVSGFVDVIEINNSFYREPSVRNSQSWLRRTEQYPEFFFTAKLQRDFTHEGKVEAGLARRFCEGFAPMLEAGKLRWLLAQFRYDFADTAANRGHLARIVEKFGEVFRLVVEVRHRSWQQEDGLGFMEGLGVSVCNLDYPTSSKSFDMPVCTVGTDGYFRLHGRNTAKWFSKAGRDETYNYSYDEKELGQIRGRIDKLADKLPTVTVIANNHYQGAELANALELKAMLSGKKVAVPMGLLKVYPRLERIAAQ